MKCDRIRAALEEYVDGGAGEEGIGEIEGHLFSCPRCREEVASLRSLKAAAADLPDAIEPRRDLWSGIDARLGRSGPGAEAGRPIEAAGSIRPRAGRRGMRGASLRPALLAASVALILAGAAYALLIVGRGGAPQPATASGAPARAPQPPAAVPAAASSPSPASVPGLNGADLAFLEARQQLRTALYERRKSLSPETIRQVDQNLGIIESAIDEIRTAVARDPGNRPLQRMLIDTRQREVALLRHVTQTADLRTR